MGAEEQLQGRDRHLAVSFLGEDQAPERPQHCWVPWEDGSALRHPQRSGG